MRLADAKIAILALQAYNLFSPDSAAVVGGAEVQLKQFAIKLRERHACRVRFICLAPEGGLAEHDGLEVARIPRAQGTLAKVLAVQRALREYAPDCVFQRSWGIETWLASHYARRHGARFVFMAAHAWDVERPALPALLKNWRRAFYWRGLRGADAVVAQSDEQAELFLRHFGIRAPVLRSFQPPPEPVCPDKRTLLWVGRCTPFKRPEKFLDLAARLSDMPCVMILNASRDQTYYDDLRRRAGALPNLRFIPYVPHGEIMPFFHEARLFVSTSTAQEGFPNTFLHAFRASTPVMSLAADPDGVIGKNAMGFVARDDFEALEREVRLRFGDTEWVRRAGANAAGYLRREHDPDALIGRWGALLEALP